MSNSDATGVSKALERIAMQLTDDRWMRDVAITTDQLQLFRREPQTIARRLRAWSEQLFGGERVILPLHPKVVRPILSLRGRPLLHVVVVNRGTLKSRQLTGGYVTDNMAGDLRYTLFYDDGLIKAV